MDARLPPVVLFERALPASLAPLLGARPVGLLPLGSRNLLSHALETLAAFGYRQVTLLLDHLPHLSREWVGQGERWGLEIRCHSVRLPGDSRIEARTLRRFLPEGGIALALDLFFSSRELLLLCEAAASAGGVLVDRDGGELPAIAIDSTGGAATGSHLPAEDAFAIDTPAALWRANLLRLTQLAGTAHLERELLPGVFVGSGCWLDESAELRPHTLVSAGSLLGRRTVVGPEAIIGKAVVLDEGSEVARSLVFDGTYVGRHALLDGKIVDGGTVVDIATGEATFVDDPAILASVLRRRDADRPSLRLLERGLALLSLAALGVPVAAWLAWRGVSGRSGLESETRFVPRGRDLSGEVHAAPVRLHTLAVRHEGWRRAPWLIAVALGRLRLAGTSAPLVDRRADASAFDDTYAVLFEPLYGGSSASADDVRREFLVNEGPVHSVRAWASWLARLFDIREARHA